MSVANETLTRPADTTADSGPQVNATATATIAAPGLGRSLYLRGVSLSGSGQPTAAVQATLADDASTNRGRWQIPAAAFMPFERAFNPPLKIAVNRGVTLTLPALGAGITGVAQLHYYVGPA
jgi:hypothetical protein